MNKLEKSLLISKCIDCFESHSAKGIEACFKAGLDPNEIHHGRPLIYELFDMYLRSPEFKNCVKVFVDFGLKFEDPALLFVMLDDPLSLDNFLTENPQKCDELYTLKCTFTPLKQATLLHICAEYNHLKTAEILLKHGADVNATAGLDSHGFGGQTPVFHTVNQHNNNSLDMLLFLIENGANLDITLKGLIWGEGYEWETFIPSINPTSYAMMGLLRQFQRTEAQIYEVVAILQKAQFGSEYLPTNIPNKYLNG